MCLNVCGMIIFMFQPMMFLFCGVLVNDGVVDPKVPNVWKKSSPDYAFMLETLDFDTLSPTKGAKKESTLSSSFNTNMNNSNSLQKKFQ